MLCVQMNNLTPFVLLVFNLSEPNPRPSKTKLRPDNLLHFCGFHLKYEYSLLGYMELYRLL